MHRHTATLPIVPRACMLGVAFCQAHTLATLDMASDGNEKRIVIVVGTQQSGQQEVA